jgi:hypothetical protein
VIGLAICFAFIEDVWSEPRHAAFVKREAFLAPGIPHTGVEQTVSSYGERDSIFEDDREHLFKAGSA